MVQLADLQTIIRELPRLDRLGIQPHAFDHDPITDADFEAFDVAVQFLLPFWPSALAQLSQRIGGAGPVGMTSTMLATRAERFSTIAGRDLTIPNGVMIAAMVHNGLPIVMADSGPFSPLIAGPAVKDALDDHRVAADIMSKAPGALTDKETKVLAILSVHGIDGPDGQIKRVFLAPRPDQIACIYSITDTMWLKTETLLPIGRAVKLGLEHLITPTGSPKK